MTISLKRLHDKHVLIVRKPKIIVRRPDILQEMRSRNVWPAYKRSAC